MPQQSDNASFTFTLPALFYLTTVLGVSAYYRIVAVVLTICVLIAWWCWFMPLPKNQRRSVRLSIVTLAVSAILVALLLPLASSTRGTHSGATYCLNNVRQSGLAMQIYHSMHKHFAPAYVADETGKPLHSWRVLLLPMLEQQALYESYDFDEP